MSIIPPLKKPGFTLIEIVIVLSIASLILVLVFVGVNGAVKVNQDDQRRSDAKRVLSVVISDPNFFAKKIADNTCFTATTSPCSLGVTDMIKQALDVTTFEDPTQVSNTNNTLENTAPGSKAYAVVLRPGDSTGVANKIEIRKDGKCKKTATGYTFELSPGSYAVISVLGPFETKKFSNGDAANNFTPLYQIYGTQYCIDT